MADDVRPAIVGITVPFGVCQVAQAKAALGAAGTFDAVEAALGNLGPTDPATISWQTGGDLALGGPLAVVIAQATGINDAGMSAFVAAASMIVL